MNNISLKMLSKIKRKLFVNKSFAFSKKLGIGEATVALE